MMCYHLKISLTTIACLLPLSEIAYAQVIPDATVNTQVDQNGNVLEITGGETRDTNLFHSFQEFSVDFGQEASFQNAPTIENIFSRVTGGNISNIDGLIRANSANLFLLSPAGIIFGENARLDIGGSFIGTSADSIRFSDGTVFSAKDTQSPPILTINAPIGLNFRDNPGDIVNRSVFPDDTGENLIGLNVPTDETLALIGGNILIEGGVLTTEGGRIELGSVAQDSTVSITPVEKGFDFGYEAVANFQDISLSAAASVTSSGVNTGDIEVQGKNISLIEGSALSINASEGQTGDINIIASESLILDNSAFIFTQVIGDATGEGSSINIDTSTLTMTNDGRIGGEIIEGSGQGVDVNINTSEIIAETSLIFSQVFEGGTGDGGKITINTEKLTLNDGAQISTDTFGPGNGGNIVVNASESIELNGTSPDIEDNTPSAIRASVGIPFFAIPSSGNGGDVTINTPRLEVTDGAQIQSTAQNNGNGGNLTIKVTDSILLTGTSPSAELGGDGRSGISVSAEPSFEEIDGFDSAGDFIFTGEIIPTTGNGGNLTLNTNNLTIEKGAFISADTFSLGDGGNANINVNQLILRDGGRISSGSLLGVEGLDVERGLGGNLNITATESLEITGIGDINGEPVNSSLFNLAESNDSAGNTTLNTGKLTISDEGDINASAIGTGAAGNLAITANSVDLDQGKITATTVSGIGGNVTLDIEDNITLRNESVISAEALGKEANGGNVTIDSEFIIASPSQPNGNDILATAVGGTGGNIEITAKSLLNIEEREAIANNGTNDIDASSDFGVDGTVNIKTPDTNHLQSETKLSKNLIEPEQTIAQACQSDRTADRPNGLTIKSKGGVPPLATKTFDSDSIIVNGEIAAPNLKAQYPEIKPIKTSIGDIYPARGVIKTKEGKVILTTYSTDNINTRTPHISANCS